MLYISLGIIFLGILIFAYSLIVDAKKRREAPVSPASGGMPGPRRATTRPIAGPGPAGAGSRRPDANFSGMRGVRAPAARQSIAEDRAAVNRPEGGSPQAVRKGPAARPEQRVVLFEDSSRVIDYDSESGSIDPSLEEYKNIRRIGSGRLVVEKGGISFFLGKKLYRYDFNRLSGMKAGDRYLALFIDGSDVVKLFIVEEGSDIIEAADSAYAAYLRSSS